MLYDYCNCVLQVVLTNHNVKSVHCIEEALRRVGLGLQVNISVSPPVMLRFIQDILKHGIDQMWNKRFVWPLGVSSPAYNIDCVCRMEVDFETQGKRVRPMKPALYSNQLLPGEPGRAGKRPQATEQATAHVLVAFGLQVSECLAVDVVFVIVVFCLVAVVGSEETDV